MDLEKKVAVVTGGGSGIGRATAEAMARCGAAVVIGNRDAGRGEEVVKTITSNGGRAVFQRTDVTKADDVKALIGRAVEEFGRLDLAFNNAGFDGKQVPLAEQTEQDVSFLLDLNIKGVFLCMKYQIEQMLKNGGGSIVNTSSIFGLNGYPLWSIYSATKHAVTGMTKAAALEYAQKGIRINAVGPGPIETELLRKGTGGDPHSYARAVFARVGHNSSDPGGWGPSSDPGPGSPGSDDGPRPPQGVRNPSEYRSSFVPMGRIGQPDEVAAAVVWLCSDAASFVTGHTLPVDGVVVAQ